MKNIDEYKKELEDNNKILNTLRKEVDDFKNNQKKELNMFEEKIGYLDSIRKVCSLEKLIENYYKDYLFKVYNLLVNTIKENNLSFYKISDELEAFDVYFEMMSEEEDEVNSFELIINEEENEFSLYLPDDYCDINVLTINSSNLEKTFEIIENYLKNLNKEN